MAHEHDRRSILCWWILECLLFFDDSDESIIETDWRSSTLSLCSIPNMIPRAQLMWYVSERGMSRLTSNRLRSDRSRNPREHPCGMIGPSASGSTQSLFTCLYWTRPPDLIAPCCFCHQISELTSSFLAFSGPRLLRIPKAGDREAFSSLNRLLNMFRWLLFWCCCPNILQRRRCSHQKWQQHKLPWDTAERR